MTAFVPVSDPFGADYSDPLDRTNLLRPQITAFERPRVITLCGSTRFMDEFENQNRVLTLQGNVVFSVATKAHEGSAVVSDEQKVLLDRVHLEKIRLSDEIFVINVGGYVGPSTRREIEFAKYLGKAVRYLVPSGA